MVKEITKKHLKCYNELKEAVEEYAKYYNYFSTLDSFEIMDDSIQLSLCCGRIGTWDFRYIDIKELNDWIERKNNMEEMSKQIREKNDG